MSQETRRAMAIGCHPDDIEFMMAGTLFQLAEEGWDIHYMNVANGSCGTQEYNTEEIVSIRTEEAKAAAAFLGAQLYPPIVPDAEVTYAIPLLRKVAAAVRMAKPSILLIPSLYDYMEDHMYTARLAATAGFVRGMPNFVTDPEIPIVTRPVAVYHALPYGLRDGYNKLVVPDFIVNIENVIEKKAEMLGKHASQRNWLDESQKLDSYVDTMREMSSEVGRKTGSYPYAEGWIRHNPLGYSEPDFKPLEDVLAERISFL